MNYSVADLYPGGIAVQDHAADLASKNVDEVGIAGQFTLVRMHGRGQVAFQLLSHSQQLLAILIADHDGRGTEDLLRQFFVFHQVLVVRNKEGGLRRSGCRY